jgi:hypothetical protein
MPDNLSAIVRPYSAGVVALNPAPLLRQEGIIRRAGRGFVQPDFSLGPRDVFAWLVPSGELSNAGGVALENSAVLPLSSLDAATVSLGPFFARFPRHEAERSGNPVC